MSSVLGVLFLVCLAAALLHGAWSLVSTVRAHRLERSGDINAAAATRLTAMKVWLLVQWVLVVFGLVIVMTAIASR